MTTNNNFNQICNTAILRSGMMGKDNVCDMLIRLVVTLIEKQEYSSFSKEQIVEDFKSFYNLPITKMTFGELMPILKKRNLIKEEEKEFYSVNIKEIKALNYLKNYEDFILKRNLLIKSFVLFAKTKNSTISIKDAEEIITNFIEDRICSMGIANPSQKENDDTDKYLVHAFINSARQNNDEYYEIFKTILVGRMLASFIVSNEKTNNEQISIFNKMRIYLDSGFVFNLLGLNNYSTSDEYKEMLSTLKGLGVKFSIFDHIFNEICEIIESSKIWIDNPDYSRSRASDVNDFFVSNNFTKEDVEEYLCSLERKLQSFGIFVEETNINYNESDNLFQQNIKNMIIEEYSKNGGFFESKDKTYEADAKSLYAIHKLRKGKIYRRIQDTEFVLLTTNRGISRVTKRIKDEYFEGKGMPLAYTDSFLSVLLFFTYPDYSEQLNERFCIPAAFHAFEPGKDLINKVEKVLSEIQNKGLITKADSLYWRTNKVLSAYIVQETNNDPDNFNEDTPAKIVELIQEDANKRIEENEARTTKEIDQIRSETDEIINRVFEESEEKIKANEKDKEALLEKLCNTKKDNLKLLNELNERDAAEKQQLSERKAAIVAKIDKTSSIVFVIAVVIVSIVFLVICSILICYANILQENEETKKTIWPYFVSAVLLLIPSISIPATAKKIKELFRKIIRAKKAKEIDNIGERIIELDKSIESRTVLDTNKQEL